jgi:hypothetical protein
MSSASGYELTISSLILLIASDLSDLSFIVKAFLI